MLNQTHAALRVVLQKKGAIESFAGTRESALRSFRVLIIDLPLFLMLSYLAYKGVMAEHQVGVGIFIAQRIAIYACSIMVCLWVIYHAARWQGVSDKYYRWIEGGNYLTLLKDIVNTPIILWGLSYSTEDQTRVTMGIVLFVMSLYCSWAMTTRAFAVSLFIGAGFTVLPMMLSDIMYDYSNRSLFGVSRPLIPEVVDATTQFSK